MKLLYILQLLFLVTAGCTSIRSTPVDRFEDGNFAGSSNGDTRAIADLPRPFKGVPITIKVPTHVDVKIIETSYMYESNHGLQELNLEYPHYDVDIQTIETEKVFTVDFKRPISGELAYGGDIGSDQYFDSISTSLSDTTITDVANLVATVAPLFATPSKSEIDATSEIGKELIVNKRVVAFKRFDIDDCYFEDRILHFLQTHVNCGHTCEGREDRRMNIKPSKNVQTNTVTLRKQSTNPTAPGQ